MKNFIFLHLEKKKYTFSCTEEKESIFLISLILYILEILDYRVVVSTFSTTNILPDFEIIAANLWSRQVIDNLYIALEKILIYIFILI